MNIFEAIGCVYAGHAVRLPYWQDNKMLVKHDGQCVLRYDEYNTGDGAGFAAAGDMATVLPLNELISRDWQTLGKENLAFTGVVFEPARKYSGNTLEEQPQVGSMKMEAAGTARRTVDVHAVLEALTACAEEGHVTPEAAQVLRQICGVATAQRGRVSTSAAEYSEARVQNIQRELARIVDEGSVRARRSTFDEAVGARRPKLADYSPPSQQSIEDLAAALAAGYSVPLWDTAINYAQGHLRALRDLLDGYAYKAPEQLPSLREDINLLLEAVRRDLSL